MLGGCAQSCAEDQGPTKKLVTKSEGEGLPGRWTSAELVKDLLGLPAQAERNWSGPGVHPMMHMGPDLGGS